MRNKKGISVISLVITILIMILLATSVVFSTRVIVRNTKKNKFSKEIQLVESAVQNYITRKSGRIDNDFSIVRWNVSDIYTENQNQFSEETVTAGIIELYEFDLGKIDIENTAYGNKKTITDRYLVSPVTNRVYYQKGYKYGNKVYYTMMDELE